MKFVVLILMMLLGTLEAHRYYDPEAKFSISVPKNFQEGMEIHPRDDLNASSVSFKDYLGNLIKIHVVTIKSTIFPKDKDHLANLLSTYFLKYVMTPIKKLKSQTKTLNEEILEIKNGRMAFLGLLGEKKSESEEKVNPNIGYLVFYEKNQFVTLSYEISPVTLQLMELSRTCSINEKIITELMNLQFDFRQE